SPAAARSEPEADTAVVRRSRGPLSEPVSGLDAGRAAPAASPTGCSFTSAAACTGPRSAAADLTTASGAVSAPPARAPRPSPPTAGGAAEGSSSPPNRCSTRGCQPSPRDGAPHGQRAHG